MPRFSQASLDRLAVLDPRLQQILWVAIEYVDFSIVVGHRSEAAQNEAFAGGYSQVRWPDSAHNDLPSRGVDIAPWFPGIGIDWKDDGAFRVLAGRLLQIADVLEIPLRWGGDWDGDGQTRDQSFHDLGHFEVPRV